MQIPSAMYSKTYWKIMNERQYVPRETGAKFYQHKEEDVEAGKRKYLIDKLIAYLKRRHNSESTG
jgi:hypothetical protein